ncbi:MAG: hypothetical protein WCI04_04150 [archaeon]
MIGSIRGEFIAPIVILQSSGQYADHCVPATGRGLCRILKNGGLSVKIIGQRNATATLTVIDLLLADKKAFFNSFSKLRRKEYGKRKIHLRKAV